MARDREGNALVMARVDGPAGSVVRVGMVNPEDTGKWRAEDKGRTVELSAQGARELRGVVESAAAKGKQSVTEHRAALRAAHKAGVPLDDRPDAEADIDSGVIKGDRWGDVRWSLTREEGPELTVGGEFAGMGGAWSLALNPAPAGTPSNVEDFHVDSPAVAGKLTKALSGLTQTAER